MLSCRNSLRVRVRVQEGGAALVAAPSAVDFQSAEFRDTEMAGVATQGAFSMKPSHVTYYAEVEKIARDLLGPDVAHAVCTSHIIRDSTGVTR